MLAGLEPSRAPPHRAALQPGDECLAPELETVAAVTLAVWKSGANFEAGEVMKQAA